MKAQLTNVSRNRGSSLIEAVIAMGVLAIAIPLVFGAIAESGKSGMSSEAETRSIWIIPACMDEIQASRDGTPRFFTATTTGETFPAAGDVWALAFSPQGKAIGKIDNDLYDKGAKEIDGQPIRFIASISSETVANTATPAMLNVRISLEYPSGAPAAKRQKIDFHTLIP